MVFAHGQSQFAKVTGLRLDKNFRATGDVREGIRSGFIFRGQGFEFISCG
jgi:hypothetical protein